MFASPISFAADAAAPAAKKASAPPKVDPPAEKKFCCKTEGGTSCYVFGAASCGNCTAFCSGKMVLEGGGLPAKK
jgi:hypothetical protein